MKITLLVDLQEHDTLAGEFGLSFMLETPGGDVLFDTGSGTALKHNLGALNIPPEKVQKVILSQPRNFLAADGICRTKSPLPEVYPAHETPKTLQKIQGLSYPRH